MSHGFLSFQKPLSAPIAAGATTPNPGYVHSSVYSTVAQTTLVWNGASWQPAVLGGRGMATVDFGVGGADLATVAVTGQLLITAGSIPIVKLAIVASANHSADEHLIEEISVFAGNIVPGVGFTIYARTNNFELFGQYNVYWMWS